MAKNQFLGLYYVKGKLSFYFYLMLPRLLLFPFLLIAVFSNSQELNPLFRIIEWDKFGYINKQGKIIIPPIFNYAYDFSEGVAVARKEGKYGYLDKKGNWSIAPRFDFAKAFHNERAIVSIKGLEYLIDKKGKILHQDGYEVLHESGDKQFYVVFGNGKEGLMSRDGTFLADGLVQGIITDNVTFIDTSGKKVNIPKWYVTSKKSTHYASPLSISCPKGLIIKETAKDYKGAGYYTVSHSQKSSFKRFDLLDIDNRGFIEGLIGVVYKHKLAYMNEDGAIVWRQNKKYFDGSVDSSYEVPKPKLIQLREYVCGRDSNGCSLVMHTAIEKTKRPIYEFDLVNTSCDTLSFGYMNYELGQIKGRNVDYNFTSWPDPLGGNYECGTGMMETSRELHFEQPIPPNYSMRFAVAGLKGCCQTKFVLKSYATLFQYKGAKKKVLSPDFLLEFLGTVDPEVYNLQELDFTGFYGQHNYFIDRYYYFNQ